MNSKQLHHVIVLSETGNFSQAAQILGITQPALSKQLMTLEKEMGVKLFDREQSPIRLTPAGERFVQDARDLLYKEEQLLRSMERFRSGKESQLTIGISPFRSLYLMPRIVKAIKAKYPGVRVCLQEWGSEKLRQEASEGKYDFAIMNLPVDESLLDVYPLEQDHLVLAVPKKLMHLLPVGVSRQIDLADCEKLPFVVVGKGQEMRQMFERLCAHSQVHPPIAMEVVGVTTAWAMANAGVGAALLPLQFVEDENFNENVVLLSIKDNTFTRQPAVVVRRGQELSDSARYAIELLTHKK